MGSWFGLRVDPHTAWAEVWAPTAQAAVERFIAAVRSTGQGAAQVTLWFVQERGAPGLWAVRVEDERLTLAYVPEPDEYSLFDAVAKRGPPVPYGYLLDLETGRARIERPVVAGEPLDLMALPYAELQAIMGTSLVDAVLGWKREDAESPVKTPPLQGYTITKVEKR